jgi:hypothetical protein
MRTFGLVLAIVCCHLAACGTPKPYQSKLDPLAIQQMQSSEFETSKDILFASVVSVFQDTGFTIEAADLDTGIVTAKSATQSDSSFWTSSTYSLTTKGSAFVEEVRPGFAKVRLNFVEVTERRGYYGGGGNTDIPVENPAVYEKTFQKIREAVFLREANRGGNAKK